MSKKLYKNIYLPIHQLISKFELCSPTFAIIELAHGAVLNCNNTIAPLLQNNLFALASHAPPNEYITLHWLLSRGEGRSQGTILHHTQQHRVNKLTIVRSMQDTTRSVSLCGNIRPTVLINVYSCLYTSHCRHRSEGTSRTERRNTLTCLQEAQHKGK